MEMVRNFEVISYIMHKIIFTRIIGYFRRDYDDDDDDDDDKESEKILKYKRTYNINGMWNLNTNVIPVIIGTTGTISK
jgi:hypothetical protein